MHITKTLTLKTLIMAFVFIVLYRISEQALGQTHLEYCTALLLVAGSYGLSMLPVWLSKAETATKFLLAFFAGFFIRVLLIGSGAVILSLFVVEYKLYFILWVGLLYVFFLIPETAYCLKRIKQLRFAPLSPFEKEENDVYIIDNEPPRGDHN